MLKNILVPLDGSSLAECVLPHAIAIAKAFDAQITLLNVLEQPADSLRMPIADPLDWHLKKMGSEAYLSAVKTRLEAIHVSVKTVFLEGSVTEQIVGFAHSNDVNLLILNSRGEYDAVSWSVRSAVQAILQQIRVSTLIIPVNHSAVPEIGDLHYRRLLVPLDGSRRAGAALPLATVLAQAHHSELVLVHVVNKPEMARQMPLAQEDVELINRFVERNQEEGNKYLEYLQMHSPTDVKTRLLVSENVAATLQSFSEQEQIDLLILSAHGYSGEAKWSYGAVTSRFITDGTMPLLIVQDQPYESSEIAENDATVRQIAR